MGYVQRIDQRFSKRNTGTHTFDHIMGASQSLEQAIAFAKHISNSKYNVLLSGESGTGKELFAQAIHSYCCPEGPFVAINCASIPRSLIESELFGYEGGAFTGANRNGQHGKIEAANGGTLFLDEIGDMPLEVQPVLLRVLEDKKVLRINSNKYIPVNFRLIAATNQNLIQMVNEKSFRNDLYYRLSVFKINIPPLRDRDEDILLLAHCFVEQICNEMRCASPLFSDEASNALLEYSWPGNVRQLKNAMIHAAYMAKDGVINIGDLPDEIICPGAIDFQNSSQALSFKKQEKAAIIRALHQSNNKGEIARQLDISKSTLYRKIKEYGIVI